MSDERDRYVAAIATGGPFESLVAALQCGNSDGRPSRPDAAIASQRRLKGSEATRVRTELLALANEWSRVLVDDPGHARPIVAALLNGRVTITPAAKAQWTLTGEGTLAGLFTREISEGSDYLWDGAPGGT